MEEYPNLSELKRKLQELNISTSTPAMVGEERYQELLSRYKASRPHVESSLSFKKAQEDVLEIKNLSMSEIRAKLTALGISTSTPGLTGEDRWNALMQRLLLTITPEKPSQANSSHPPVQTVETDIYISANRKPPESIPDKFHIMEEENLKSAVEREYSRVMTEITEEKLEPILEAPDAQDINDIKKQIKKISNKRAVAIASQLSADQDSLLTEFTSLLAKVESDLTTCRNAVARCEHKIPLSSLKSQLWQDKGKQAEISVVQEKLARKRDELKESIQHRRGEIRHAAENHPEYGLQVEEDMKAELAQMQFTQSKVSRARRKIHDSKSLDSAMHDNINAISVMDNESEKKSPTNAGLEVQSKDAKESAPVIKAKVYPPYNPPIPQQEGNSLRDEIVYRGENNIKNLHGGFSNESSPSDSESVHLSAGKRQNETAQDRVDGSDVLAHSPYVFELSPPVNVNAANEIAEKRRNYEIFLKTGQFPSKKSPTGTTPITNSPAIHPQESSTKNILPPRKLDFSESPAAPPASKLRRQPNTPSVVIQVQPPNMLDNENNLLIEELLKHSKSLQRADDILAAEILLERALDMEPMNVLVLQTIARFLHVKKGELARAEAFFNRGLQVSLPQLYSQLTALTLQQRQLNLRFSQDLGNIVSVLSPLLQRVVSDNEDGSDSNKPTPQMTAMGSDSQSIVRSPANASNDVDKLKSIVEQSSVESRFKVPHIVSLLLSFGKFLLKAKGDIDAAALLFQHAAVLAPDHADSLANYAHFLTEHLTLTDTAVKSELPTNSVSGTTSVVQQIDSLFQRALQCAPGHPIYLMWYAKFLKKLKKLGPAEFMYRSAWEIATRQQTRERKATIPMQSDGQNEDYEDEDEGRSLHNQEAIVLCNYATFLFKHRPNKVRQARDLFVMGLEKYPDHAGLRKNYQTLEKKVAKHPELLSKFDLNKDRGEENDDSPIFSHIQADEAASPSPSTKTNSGTLQTILETETLGPVEQLSAKPQNLSIDTSNVCNDGVVSSPIGSPSRLTHNSSSSSLSSCFRSPKQQQQTSTSRQPSRAGSSGSSNSQMQSRGSRRAQRMQQSLALQVPTDLITAEERASFILERVKTANSSCGSLKYLQNHSRLDSADTGGYSHSSSNVSIRGGIMNPLPQPTNPSAWNLEGTTNVSDHEFDEDEEVHEGKEAKRQLEKRVQPVSKSRSHDLDDELSYEELLKRRDKSLADSNHVPKVKSVATHKQIHEVVADSGTSNLTHDSSAHMKEKEKPKRSIKDTIGSSVAEMAALFHHSTELPIAKPDRTSGLQFQNHHQTKKESKRSKDDDNEDEQVLNVRINRSALNGKL